MHTHTHTHTPPHTHTQTHTHINTQGLVLACTDKLLQSLWPGWNTCSPLQTHKNRHTHLVPKGICPQPKSSQLLRKNSSIKLSGGTNEIHLYMRTHTHTHIHTHTPPTRIHTVAFALILSQSVALIGVLMIL